MISAEAIERFINGRDPQKYIVAIETNNSSNKASLIINDPTTGKRIETKEYRPFIWMKRDVTKKIYNGKRDVIRAEMLKYGITIKQLKKDKDGTVPKRMQNSYEFIVSTNKGFDSIINFFRAGGVDPYKSEYSRLFFRCTTTEQYMMQTGKRLFKGMDDYDDVDRFQFDLETEGLDPNIDAIFQIGMRNNRGFELILETEGETPSDRRASERSNIIRFFKELIERKPDIIAGYNSDNFDWDFIEKRCDRLGLNIFNFVTGMNGVSKLNRKSGNVKIGQDTEKYTQTNLWGHNIIDASHSVRRAQAINSDIKSWSLKYITKHSKVNKKNRVYIDGNKIHTVWADKDNEYTLNELNGDWSVKNDESIINENTKVVSGKYIVQRYLMDDLWETEKVDYAYNQSTFIFSKWMPTSFVRCGTMGTAGQWTLLLSAWSYENNLAIPEYGEKRKFTGGLSRLFSVGYAEDVSKLDYAALYPKTTLTYDIFPETDISGVMKGLLLYVVDTRDKYKFIASECKELIAVGELDNVKLSEIKRVMSDADKKQLPVKILANSFFGSYGAPYIFPWGDITCAERITCISRQNLRLMVSVFKNEFGFKPLVGDSVTYDTPIYIRYDDKSIDIVPISDIFNEKSTKMDLDGYRDFEPKPFEILTRSGWKNIKYVYRHNTDKNIHRIITKDRLINATEDHSLFKNGNEIKPSQLNRGDKIDCYDIPFSNIKNDINKAKAYFLGSTLNNKKIPNKILNSNKDVKKAFISGLFAIENSKYTTENATDLAALSLILNELKIDYKFNKNYISLNAITRTKKKSDIVWKNEIISNKDKNKYVYDVSTDDGTFVCGINGIIAHNTDGFNLSMPSSINEYKYICKGTHWKTKKFKDVELSGLNAAVSYFNEKYMKGWMGLDIDDVYQSTINFSKKNYANLINNKVKLVGNSVKSKKTAAYITDVLNDGILLLLNNKGDEFIELYNKTAIDVFNNNIPIHKIASKAKVKETIDQYNEYCKQKNINGVNKAKKAHMELAISNKLNPKIGDTIYYVNTSTSASKGDVSFSIDKKTKRKSININCVLISEEDIEGKVKTDIKYNELKYLKALNKKMMPLLVCFNPEIRDKILLDPIKNRKTKKYTLSDINVFTENECKLVSGYPIEVDDQDDYITDFEQMEDKEIMFWLGVNETPVNMSEADWNTTKSEYLERLNELKENEIDIERLTIINICKNLTITDINEIRETGEIPSEILNIATLNLNNSMFTSIKHNEGLAHLSTLFKYEKMIEIKNKFNGIISYIENNEKESAWDLFNKKVFKRGSDFEYLSEKNEMYVKWIDYVSSIGFDMFNMMNDADIRDVWMDIISNNEPQEA